MPLNFIISQKGKELLNYNGYLYYLHHRNKNSLMWKCNAYKNNSCPAVVHTNLDKSKYLLY